MSIDISTLHALFTKMNNTSAVVFTGNLYYNDPINMSTVVSTVNQNAETLSNAYFNINTYNDDKNKTNIGTLSTDINGSILLSAGYNIKLLFNNNILVISKS